MNARLDRLAYCVALALAVAPLWATGPLPMVDLPQHLHLISVLHRLEDPTTLFPAFFALRGQLTPYLGYYHAVSLLSWLLPLELANKAFLTAYVAGLPLSLAFLLRSLKRPAWPSLLAVPFAYGDSFAWGFVNYCSALPLAFLCCGLFVRAIAEPAARKRWAFGLCACLVAVLLFHVQVFAFLGLALPLLLATTRAGDERGGGLRARLAPRWAALVAVVPGVALFLAWVGLRLGQPAEVEAGAPWKAWGPLLSPQNLSFKTSDQNARELTQVLANQLRDGTDRWGLWAVAALAALAVAAGLWRWRPGAAKPFGPPPQAEGPIERWRLLGLAAIALGLYFALPFDIRGYMYYLNTRYAHLAAPLVLAAVPVLGPRTSRALLWASAAAALAVAVPLCKGFARFGEEASGLARVAEAAADRPRVMGLVYDPSSRVVMHPVYLHAAADLARRRGGVSNFSFALTPHSPLRYQGAPPPTYPSEWRPDQFRYDVQGPAYDHFLVRGAHPAQLFGARLATELYLAGEASGFYLLRRR